VIGAGITGLRRCISSNFIKNKQTTTNISQDARTHPPSQIQNMALLSTCRRQLSLVSVLKRKFKKVVGSRPVALGFEATLYTGVSELSAAVKCHVIQVISFKLWMILWTDSPRSNPR
jgi:hypothetical protein